MNVITGLPRSGSTLLCNVLNQNPSFQANSTSVLCEIMSMIVNKNSNSPEVTGELVNDKEGFEDKIRQAMGAYCSSFFDPDKTAFDKSRAWANNSIVLREIFPESVIICCVRNPIDVISSIEKQNRKNPLFEFSESGGAKTLLLSAEAQMGMDGIVGSAIIGVLDLIERDVDGVVFVDGDEFFHNPAGIMKDIYKVLGEKKFKHDFNNVKNVSTDLDALYRYKFPHKGSGKIKPGASRWSDNIDKKLALDILNKYPRYTEYFGYKL